ncbi:hypothetical protein [Streptomyces werraensis]|uniref:hypothetical protein n=1 Tax=Streptomyces werraensis TaxID=68284 RepID=UPI0033BF4CA8
MALLSRLRKFALTVHVMSSVGWFGAVAASLSLAVVGLTSQDTQTVRASYVAMEPVTWFVVVPLAFASLLTGLVSALGSTWGLFRHHWVLLKLVLTSLATVVLLIHTQPVGHMAGVAAQGPVPDADQPAQVQLVVAAAAALLVFLVTTTVGVQAAGRDPVRAAPNFFSAGHVASRVRRGRHCGHGSRSGVRCPFRSGAGLKTPRRPVYTPGASC